MLRVEQLATHAGDAPLAFEIPTGQTTGLLGRDAQLLSRVIEATAGLRTPVSGNIHFDGIDLIRNAARARPQIALSLVRAIDRHTSLAEHVGVVAATRRCRLNPKDALVRLGLDARMRLDTPAARSAAALAAALLPEAGLVLLHEPFRDLDAATREKAVDWIRSLAGQPTSILITGTGERDVRAVSHQVVELGAGR
jgi:ABC-type sulfate/molybdate transport systems ATPase subunit